MQPVVVPHAPSTFDTLPPGWTTQADPRDGRLFYWHAATGSASWTHPHHDPAAGSTTRNHNVSTTTRDIRPGDRERGQPQPPPLASFDYLPHHHNPAAIVGASENPYMASRRPDNHQCSSVAALLLCPPLGLFAVYHSSRVDSCWKAGQYSDAVVHARQASQFSSWGILLGSIFWICWFFFRRGRGEWEWPDWKLGD